MSYVEITVTSSATDDDDDDDDDAAAAAQERCVSVDLQMTHCVRCAAVVCAAVSTFRSDVFEQQTSNVWRENFEFYLQPEADRHTHTHTHTHTHRQTDTQTNRHTDRQTDRQTDRP